MRVSTDEIDRVEGFFREEIVYKRTPPNVAARRLLEAFPEHSPDFLCFCMTVTVAALEEWRDLGGWNEWAKAGYWLKIVEPKRYEAEFNVDISVVIFELYRTISIVNCDGYLASLTTDRDVVGSDLLSQLNDLQDDYFAVG